MRGSTAGFTGTGESSLRLTGLHALLLVIYTSVILSLLVVLAMKPDWVAAGLGKLAIRTVDEVAEKKGQFYLDIVILWVIGFAVIALDALSRTTQGSSLMGSLFLGRRHGERQPTFGLRLGALIASFVLAPALVAINLGQNALGTRSLIAEDGFFENATVVGFGLASFLLGRAAVRLLRARHRTSRRQGVFLLALAVCLFLVGMEEISWGQRIFGWQTPENLGRINTQAELNVHNIFTGYFEAAYLVVAASLFAAVCLSCLGLLVRHSRGKGGGLIGILPDGSLLFLLGLILVFSCHLTMNELVEELATLVIILYGLHVHMWTGGIGQAGEG